MVGASGVLVWGYACMHVRNGFTIEIYTGLCIVYVRDNHDADSEDRRRCQNKSRDRRWNKDKTGDNLRISTRAIYFARWPVDGIGGGQHGIILIGGGQHGIVLIGGGQHGIILIGGGQHGIVLTALRASPFWPIKFSSCSAWGRWCACVYLVRYATHLAAKLCRQRSPVRNKVELSVSWVFTT